MARTTPRKWLRTLSSILLRSNAHQSAGWFTAFIMLYHIGVVLGEKGLPLIKEKKIILGFDFLCAIQLLSIYPALLLVYPFLLLKLYLHMFKQRRSMLHRGHEKKQSSPTK